MGIDDKARNVAEKAGGQIKEGWGKLTDDERLEAEGKAQQLVAEAKQAGEHVKDAGDDVKKAFRN
ncbi:MAG: CsbD family protein [Micropruina sp.]|nr:CsbD family protein [Micropruina sp.]